MDDGPRDQQTNSDRDGDSGALDEDDDEDGWTKRLKELPSLNTSPKFVPYAQKGRLDSTSSVAPTTSASEQSTASSATPPSPTVALPADPPAPSSVATAPAAASSAAADPQPSFPAAPQEPPPVAPSPPRPVPPAPPQKAPRPSPESPSPSWVEAPPVAPAAPALPVDENGPNVVPRIVATWRAPEDGGVAGRLYKYDELAFDSLRRRVGHGKFLAGNRRRDLRDQVPSKSSREAYIKASREGKSCCAKAVWFD